MEFVCFSDHPTDCSWMPEDAWKRHVYTIGESAPTKCLDIVPLRNMEFPKIIVRSLYTPYIPIFSLLEGDYRPRRAHELSQ